MPENLRLLTHEFRPELMQDVDELISAILYEPLADSTKYQGDKSRSSPAAIPLQTKRAEYQANNRESRYLEKSQCWPECRNDFLRHS